MKLIYIFILVFVLFFHSSSDVRALVDPLDVPNNKFGIHIIDENDLENAARLVNSSGGDWGYVTLVISEQDRNLEKWQKIFGRMKKLHLIPILRLATRLDHDTWRIPQTNQARSWSEFLNQLNWPTKNRYIVIFNEPNHTKEWGGQIDPVGYAEIISSFSASLKQKSADFFILPAGFDASAPNSSPTMDEVIFLKKMLAVKPYLFDFLDGWTSHAYPNHGFVGKVTDTGRGTLRTYLWEIELLKSLGVEKKLPIFITETGWPHQEGAQYNRGYYSASKVADLIFEAAEKVWQDENIVALTPFILNYQSYPFSNFSWQKYASSDFYPQYEVYQSLSKTPGKPVLEEIAPANKILPVNKEQSWAKNLLLKVPFLASFISKLNKL